MVVSDDVGVSGNLSVEAGFLLPLCGGRLSVLGRCGHKEGRSNRQGNLRHELDISNLQTQCEWVGVDPQSLVSLYGSNLVSVFPQHPHIDTCLPLRAVVYVRIQYHSILPQCWLHSRSIGSHTHHTGRGSGLP